MDLAEAGRDPPRVDAGQFCSNDRGQASSCDRQPQEQTGHRADPTVTLARPAPPAQRLHLLSLTFPVDHSMDPGG